MASARDHLAQARHNERFLADCFELHSSLYLDWAATVLFYAALHYLRALGSHHGHPNISRYGQLDALFQRVAAFRAAPDVYADYRTLKDESRAARYDMARYSPEEVASLRDQELARIRTFAAARLPE